MLDFYKKNRFELLSKIKQQSIVLLFSNSRNINLDLLFDLNKNFYYLTGISENNIALLMIKEFNGENKTFLFLERPSLLKKKWDGESLNLEEASKISYIPLENCLDINSLDSFLINLLNNSKRNSLDMIQNVYLDFSFSSLDKNNLSLDKSDWLKTNYPYVDIHDISVFLSEMRITKKKEEISFMSKAVDINREAFQEIIPFLKSDFYEYQISAFYNYFLANLGLKSSFNTIVATGKNATVLHYNKQKDLIKSHDLILLDLGVSYNNYASDVSRCFPVSGTFTPQQKLIYNIVLKANKKIIEWVKPGHTFFDINQYGKNILSDELQKNHLLKKDETIEKYCYHGLSHYLGLDVHDVGSINKPILENSVITVEPGLYFEEFNLGIRIEDDVLIKKEKNIVLTKDIPKEIEEIEYLMSQRK
ncbi:Xaa-Pro aminopeptidase [Candidatus Phytoplasma luffae]|uniref:Xaa-Pro aminopeptidase n=1 Tax=Loofah witches'-broom phytoplasma TaxID=35773 RepID=A0A975ILT1_LOWBP|nr:aminopeptidase P family protein [Candidatus Phytoplasma luffae]QTX02752.1 Xaa-Pro aminopeptidase [Candidatus Phytoplasma luffae]